MRSKIESLAFALFAGAYLVNEAWGFYNKNATISSAVTSIFLYLPWLAAVGYVAYRLWSRPAKVASPTLDELDVAIREHASTQSPETTAAVEQQASEKLGRKR